MRATKIVATLGPASSSPEVLEGKTLPAIEILERRAREGS